VWPVGKDGDDQPVGVGSDGARLTAEAFGRPLGITTMGARHVLGVGAVPTAAVAPAVGGNALAAMDHLDGMRGEGGQASDRNGGRLQIGKGGRLGRNLQPGQALWHIAVRSASTGGKFLRVARGSVYCVARHREHFQVSRDGSRLGALHASLMVSTVGFARSHSTLT
jgi:hypothetical protein